MPSRGLWLMIALLALLAAGKAILYDTLDPDCFWHLRVAEQLQHDGIGPIVDDLSFASIKTPWTPYSWLAELSMKQLWDTGGWRAAILMQAICMAAFVILVARCAMTRCDDNPLAIIIAVVIAMYFSLPYLSFRPVTFAIVLLALCDWLLLRDRKLNEQSKLVWLIIPITTLITNIHFFSILVPLWIGALLVGALIERRNVKRYAMLFVLALLACCATPMLRGLIRSMWDYQFSDPMVGGGVIAEFKPFWSGALGIVSVIFVLMFVASIIFDRGKLRTGEKIWALIAILLLFRMGRFAPVAAPIAAAILAARLPKFSSDVVNRKAVQLAVCCILVIGLVRIGFAFPNSNTQLDQWLNRHGEGTPGYPTAAADFVSAHVSSGRVINEFSWGGYIAWKLGDRYQVLVDGRTQVYSPQFWRTMFLSDVQQSQSTLANARASAAILPADHSRFKTVLLQLGWQSAYRDDRAEVLLPPTINASINP